MFVRPKGGMLAAVSMKTFPSQKTQVEVRLITYRRPMLLDRALKSLQNQTISSWRAIVFDDSLQREGEEVVKHLNDDRIIYRPNAGNLGMVCNTSQAFSSSALVEGSQYACVLEDDNFYDPELLAENLRVMEQYNASVLARNYRIMEVGDDGCCALSPHQPMADLWGREAREISYEERIKEAFFSFVLGNLGYFWKLNRGVDLSVSEERLHGPVSETSRSISFKQPCWYEPIPLATFSRFLDKLQTPRGANPVSKKLRRVSSVSEIQLTKRLVAIWTRELKKSMKEIFQAAESRDEGPEAIQRLANAGCIPAYFKLERRKDWIVALKARCVSLLCHGDWDRLRRGA
jgi:hypothetical protein